jgi:hypothetical protein
MEFLPFEFFERTLIVKASRVKGSIICNEFHNNPNSHAWGKIHMQTNGGDCAWFETKTRPVGTNFAEEKVASSKSKRTDFGKWRTRHDSNVWPLPSEGSALSS